MCVLLHDFNYRPQSCNVMYRLFSKWKICSMFLSCTLYKHYKLEFTKEPWLVKIWFITTIMYLEYHLTPSLVLVNQKLVDDDVMAQLEFPVWWGTQWAIRFNVGFKNMMTSILAAGQFHRLFQIQERCCCYLCPD